MGQIPKVDGKEPTQKELLYSLGTMLYDIKNLLIKIVEQDGNKEESK